MSDQEKLLINTERVRSVLQQAPLALLVSIINVVFTAIVLVPVASHAALSAWVVAIIAVAAVRWMLRQRVLRPAFDTGRYRVLAGVSVLGSATTGLLWGVGAAFLSPDAETHQLFFAFVIGGMCAGTTAINSAHAPTVLAFILTRVPLSAAHPNQLGRNCANRNMDTYQC